MAAEAESVTVPEMETEQPTVAPETQHGDTSNHDVTSDAPEEVAETEGVKNDGHDEVSKGDDAEPAKDESEHTTHEPGPAKENKKPSPVGDAKKTNASLTQKSLSPTASKRISTTSSTVKKTSGTTSVTPAKTSSTRSTAGSTLSKPPTRPVSSTTHKPAATSTPTHRSRPSMSSSADEKGRSVLSSGDESKKSVSSTKRASLTAATKPPVKPASSDRRTTITPTARTTTAHRPVTLTTPVKPAASKPVTTSTISTAATKTTPPSATTKTAARPTSTTGHPASPATKTPVGHAASASKITELKSQLDAKEAQISELQRKYDEVLTKIEKAGADNISASDALRAKHSAKIEEISDAHNNALKELQAKVEEYEQKNKELAEKSTYDLAEAKSAALADGDSKTAQILEEQKAAHATALEAVQKELEAQRSSSTDLASQLSSLKDELASKASSADEASKAANQKAKETLATHQGEIEKFQTQLNTEESTSRDLREQLDRLEKAKDEALRVAHSDADAFREEVRALTEKMTKSEADVTDNNNVITVKLAEQENEISALSAAAENMKNGHEEASKAHDEALKKQASDINSEHEKFVAGIKSEHESAFSSLKTSHEELTQSYSSAISAKGVLEKKVGEHEKELEELNGTISALNLTKTQLQEEVDNAKDSYGTEIKALKDALDAANANVEKQADVTRESERKSIASIQTLEEKVRSLEQDLQSGTSRIQSLTSDLEAERTQVERLQNNLDILEKEYRERGEHYEGISGNLKTEIEAANKLVGERTEQMRAEIESANRLVEERTQQISTLEANHVESSQATEKLLEERTQQLSALEARHLLDLEESKKAHNENLEKALADLQESHATALREVRSRCDALVASNSNSDDIHAAALDSLKKEHTAVVEAKDAELRSIAESHAKSLADLKSAFDESHSKTEKELLESRSKISTLESSHSNSLEEITKTHERNLLDLKASLQKAQEEAVSSAEKTGNDVIAQLNERIASLDQDLRKLTEEKQELEKLVSVVQKTDDELNAFKSRVNELEQDLETTVAKAKNLDECERELSAVKARVQELEASEAQLETLKSERTKLSEDMAQLVGKNLSLTQDLGDAQDVVSQHKRQMRELEFQLKEAQAATELKGDGEGDKDSAAKETSDESVDSVAGKGEGEDNASSIDGTMASIQEQMRQLESVGRELLDEHIRVYRELSKVSLSDDRPTLSRTTTTRSVPSRAS